MTETTSRNPLSHLKALAVAVVLLVPLLAFSPRLFHIILRPMMRDLMALPSPEKNQGMLLQREAFLYRDVIPIYGSSELTVEMDKRAGDFFRWKAKGFQVCPVGAAGNTTFMMAQKIAALGNAVRGRKVAVILSSTWFRRAEVPKGHMEGNFSPLQAINIMRTSALDEPLRQRFMTRLLDFPTVMEDHPLLDLYVHDVVNGRTSGPQYRLVRKMLWGWGAVLSWEDRLSCVTMGLGHHMEGIQSWRIKPMETTMSRLIKQLEREDPDEENSARLTPAAPLPTDGPRDQDYLEVMSASKEWDDLALLLDTLKDLKAEALIISVPMPGVSMEKHGLSRAARDYYYNRVSVMSIERGFKVENFSDHDLDQDFILGASTHFTTKGWLYVDRLLDEFYHDRLPPSRIRS